jgi:hypothetical protein
LVEWAIDRLRVASPRLEEPFEWIRNQRSRREILEAPPTMTLTAWGQIPKEQLCFVRSIDLSALGEWPKGATLSDSFFLESVILSERLRVIPVGSFGRCPRLAHVGITHCLALEEIESAAFRGGRSLREFVLPLMVRVVDAALGASRSCASTSRGRERSRSEFKT